MNPKTLLAIAAIAILGTACVKKPDELRPTEYPVTHEACSDTDPVQSLTDQECLPAI